MVQVQEFYPETGWLEVEEVQLVLPEPAPRNMLLAELVSGTEYL